MGSDPGVNNWPFAENPAKIVDGIGQKHLNFAELNTGAIITPGVGSTIAQSIKLWTANDAADRDPASFQLYGTNATITGAGPFALANFTLIASAALSLPSTRNNNGALLNSNSQTLDFANSTAYTTYMLLFPTVKNQASANSMQIAEVQLFGDLHTVPEPSMGLSMLLAMINIWSGLRRRS